MGCDWRFRLLSNSSFHYKARHPFISLTLRYKYLQNGLVQHAHYADFDQAVRFER